LDYKIKLKNICETSEIVRLPNDAQGFVLSQILKNFTDQDCVIVAENDLQMENFATQIRFFFPEVLKKFEILFFPAWDCLPYDRASPKAAISSARIKCLYKISQQNSGKKFLILTNVNSVLQKTLAPAELKNYGLKIAAKSKISIAEISNFLITSGYERSPSANMAGEFAVRGGIVDFVTEKAADLIGYRIDFFGDEIESIRAFDPLTQITQEQLREIKILPASEVALNEKTVATFRQKYREEFATSLNDQLYSAISEKRSYVGMEHWLPFFYEENLVSFFDYFLNCERALTIFLNQKIFSQAQARGKIIEEYFQARIDAPKQENNYHPIAPNLLYLSHEELQQKIAQHQKISLNSFDATDLNQRIFDLEIKPIPDFALAGRSNRQNPFQLFKTFFPHNPQQKIVISCFGDASRSQISRILHDYDLNSVPIENFAQISSLPKNFIGLINLPLNHGFQTSDLIFISEQDLLGEKVIRRKSANKAASQRLVEEGLSINLGELVVHRDHGIGKFDGIHTITVGDSVTYEPPSSRLRVDLLTKNDHLGRSFDVRSPLDRGILAPQKKNLTRVDMIKILYGGGDVLFVPVDDINLITRYGADNPLIQLDRLGNFGWKNRKEKVRNKIKIAAEELLKIAAARHLKKAPIFVPDQHFYDEFKARFGFVETEDQAKAIEEVEEDLQRGSPMDRLVCGDVGFGKTEVALRASAVVVGESAGALGVSKIECDLTPTLNPIQETEILGRHCERSEAIHEVETSGLLRYARNDDLKDRGQIKYLTPNALRLTPNSTPQIAIVAPTTLLVRQHFKNFTKRFENTGIKIAQLSRLVSAADAKKTRAELEVGAVDIVIGTHALLQKNIKFKNLALVIIDEEQHFGVAQKERLKELRNEVHILTLSATPIPRTLQMSLTGVKDLSLIATPPIDRLAVRNFTMPYDSVIVREAVLREHNRSGRVFFVVPRIRDIEEMEPRLKTLLPEIKIRHAHGGMAPTELDEIMNDFVDGKIDMLLSTTIIESGIDISEANTMIIYRAEMFGLSQLYQLRGRVGRGKVRAYAYLMLSPKKLSDESRKKLEVMQNLDSLGVGFSIASHDMDIRGSGNLLGDEQSGHVRETGVELYQQMLLETIEDLKKESLTTPSALRLTPYDYSIQLKLGISLLIPEPYMPDLSLRMNFYKKIARVESTEDQEILITEMTDRFGKIPEEILNLMEVARLKFACKKVGIEKLEVAAEGIFISFKDNKFAAPEDLMQLIFSSKNQIKLHAGQKVFFAGRVTSIAEKFSFAFTVIQRMSALIDQLKNKV
jgi:transcription-repair coupling factor (superfamily II helicase)